MIRAMHLSYCTRCHTVTVMNEGRGIDPAGPGRRAEGGQPGVPGPGHRCSCYDACILQHCKTSHWLVTGCAHTMSTENSTIFSRLKLSTGTVQFSGRFFSDCHIVLMLYQQSGSAASRAPTRCGRQSFPASLLLEPLSTVYAAIYCHTGDCILTGLFPAVGGYFLFVLHHRWQVTMLWSEIPRTQ
jgi:hypothetical protein